MKNFAKFFYLFFSVMLIANIIWVIYHWNTYDKHVFITFDVSKYVYLPMLMLFTWAFIDKYRKIVKAEKEEKS